MSITLTPRLHDIPPFRSKTGKLFSYIMHIVFLNKNYAVNTVEDAFKLISPVFKDGHMGFITGPSRTADIERVLTIGVHGPARFIIIAIDETNGGAA